MFYGLFLEAILRVSSHVLVAVPNILFLYLSDRFLANDQSPYPLTYCLVLRSVEESAICMQ